MIKKSPKIKLNKYARREEIIDMQSFIVVAVEGDSVEPNYFKMLESKFKDVRLEIIRPETKSSPECLLENLRRIKRKYCDSSPKDKPESFWMVCDVDSHKNLQSTIKKAKDEDFKLAISNPCFEVWLFLHLAEIKIEKGVTKFCKADGEILLEIDNSKKPDRTLSKKVKKILDKIRPKNCSQDYEGVYFKKIDDAIKKSQNNLKAVPLKDFLSDSKHIGQTKVGFLVSDIKDKSPNS